MTMKPLADRVLIKVEKEEEKTVGGLVLATKNPMEVKVGDTVLISHSAGQTVKLDGEELTLVYESEILGITE